jgi:epoxyqueuosine reductase
MTARDDIQAEAFSLGFSLFGVTNLAEPPHVSVFTNWLRQGRHASMEYLNSARSILCREDPSQIIPGAQSMILLGIPYSSPVIFRPSEQAFPGAGRIAAYAWGKDYHLVIPPRLQFLADMIKKIIGIDLESKMYTDTGPILERDLAQRAGLGWIGKNTNLIAPGLGSFFLLAELIVGVDLPTDRPFEFDRCGACTRCMKACPTQCILPDRTIDANRCISYLTIENKGSISWELRPLIGNWVFGCDICQEVCPWNHRYSMSADSDFLPKGKFPYPVLKEEIRLSGLEFNQKFKDSPVKRAKRKGYLRNIAVAAGNLKDDSTISPLIQVLQSEPDPLVRSHTAWALGQFGPGPARNSLEKALTSENDLVVREEIILALQGNQAG